jgi:type IV pilus assembly protein PilX
MPIHRSAPSRQHQHGAALAIGLILLVILTLLAFTGINAATTDLAMAGNEQFRKNAAQASAAGLEVAVADLVNVRTVQLVPLRELSGQLPGSATERYATEASFLGTESGLPQSSVDKFVGLHYEITSNGTSQRGGRDAQTQGVFVVASQTPPGGGRDIAPLPANPMQPVRLE